MLDASMSTAYPWMRAFHIVFMVTWFAGLFYLPRLFVYHAELDRAAEPAAHERFVVMARRLFAIMTLGAALTLLLGVGMLLDFAWAVYGDSLWLHAKLGVVVALVAYHAWCRALMLALAEGRDRHSPRWYRWFNEVPAVALIAIVLLASLRPS